MTLPAGLATISGAMDDTPNARGAVDMARRLGRAQALSELAALDAGMIGSEAIPDRVFTDHASLVVSAAYRHQDARAVIFRADGRIEAVG